MPQNSIFKVVIVLQNKPDDKIQKVLDFVNTQVNENGYPPSIREICTAVGLKSTSTAHSYIVKLEKMGLIQKDPSKPRALKLLNRKQNHHPSSDTQEISYVPIIGKVTAGQPILAVENIEGTFPIPVNYLQNSDTFMLRVSGDSMIEAGIFDNDFIIVNKQSTAENGNIVVALIGDEVTVKTFYKEDNQIHLQPQNKLYKPIIINSNIQILGKVIGIFRQI
jgi:repressor LexA